MMRNFQCKSAMAASDELPENGGLMTHHTVKRKGHELVPLGPREVSTPVKANKSNFIAGCSNFSVQYNYACASMASAIMLSHRDETAKNIVPDYPEPSWAKDVLLSVVFVGSVVGMLTMGYLGDLLGISKALIITNTLVVLGALASALLSWGSAPMVWEVIAVSRFILGAGVGGNYPLSAAKAAKSGASSEAVSRAGRAFFWQGPGGFAPYVLGLFLLELPHTPHITSWQFRILLGVGALPALVGLQATISELGELSSSADARSSDEKRKLRGALRNPRHWKLLVGTAGTWFLFDIAFYGTIIFSPNILGDIFGPKQSLTDLALRAAFMSTIGIVATASGLWALTRVPAKTLNTVGFCIGGILFSLFAYLHTHYPSLRWTLFGLLCLLYFVFYAGPNVATFVLPVISYPTDVRSTFHGLSSAAAKVGAMLGALLFPVVDQEFGVTVVMKVQAIVCFVGALVSHFCLLRDPVLEGGADEDAAASSVSPNKGDAGIEVATLGRSPAEFE